MTWLTRGVLLAAACAFACSLSSHETRYEERIATLDVDAGSSSSATLAVDVDRHEALVTGPTHTVEVEEQLGPPVVIEQPDGGHVVLPGAPTSRKTTTTDTGGSAWAADEHTRLDAAAQAAAWMQAHGEDRARADVATATDVRLGPSPLAWAGIALGLGLAAAIALWVARKA